MNKDQAIALLKHEQKNKDAEAAHGNADRALCELLITLGYKDVIDEWKKVKKWYA